MTIALLAAAYLACGIVVAAVTQVHYDDRVRTGLVAATWPLIALIGACLGFATALGAAAEHVARWLR